MKQCSPAKTGGLERGRSAGLSNFSPQKASGKAQSQQVNSSASIPTSRLEQAQPGSLGGAAVLMDGLKPVSPELLKILAANTPGSLFIPSARNVGLWLSLVFLSFLKFLHRIPLCFSLSFPKAHAGTSHTSCSQDPSCTSLLLVPHCCWDAPQFLTHSVCSTLKIAFIVLLICSRSFPGPSACLLTAEGASLILFGRTMSAHQLPRNS